MNVRLALAIALVIAGCGSEDAPGSDGTAPTPDGAAGSAGAQLDAAREAESGSAGGAGTGGTAGAGGTAGRAGGGAAGTAAGSGGGGIYDAGAPGDSTDAAIDMVDAAIDAGAAPDADAAPVDIRPPDAGGEAASDAPADAASSVCSPPSPPYDCNSGCKQPTDALWPNCSRVCTTATAGYAVSGATPQDVSIIFPPVTQTEVGCLSCAYATAWSFSVYNTASGSGCVRVSTSPGRFVQPYESAAAATQCAGPTLPTATCAVVSHSGSESKAIVVLASPNAPRGWVRVETGACPMACP
jgi:hypothetical protein